MTQPATSRQRFQDFLKKFRRNEVGLDEHEKAQLQEKSRVEGKRSDGLSLSTQRTERKVRRRRYLRLYLRELQPYLGQVSVLVLLSLVIAFLDLIQPLFYRQIVDGVLLNDQLDSASKQRILHQLGWITLAVVILSQGLGILKNYRQYLLNVKVIVNLRRGLFDRMIHLPLAQLSDMKTGGIISRLTDDVNTTTGLFEMAIVSPTVAGIRLLISLGILFFLNWQLALTAISVIPVVMGISLLASRRIRPIYRQIRDDVSIVDGRVGEAFAGIRAVRAFQGEAREEHEYTVGHNTITRMKLFARKKELVLWSSWGFLMASIGLVIFWVGGYLYIQGRATIGDITAFQVYTFMLLNPVWQIVNSFSELQRSLAAMERVFEILESPQDKPDLPDALPAPARVETIEFQDVWFAYEGDQYVVRDFKLSVKGGSVVALVGKSGAGKTTVTDLLARFHDPTRGRLLLNGIDLRQLQLDSYRKLLGVVQQEVFLFDGSIRDNIAYADREATFDEIVDAAKRAHAHEFIEKLPQGYDTEIGERGIKLSGGQRQRMSIARALLANPQILILDEATSNLDTESEQLIQASIEELLKHRTTFMIAHRLSTISHADQIVVLDRGQIVESGKHEELLARGGLYAEMVARQNSALLLE